MARSFGSAVLVIAALGSALGCYTVSLKVSAERAAVDKLRVGMVADARDIRMLTSELHTRSRMPELERWNNSVLALSAPTEKQFVPAGVQLASYAPGAARPQLVQAAQLVPAVQALPRSVQIASAAPAKTAPAPVAVAPRTPEPRSAEARPLAAGMRQIAYTVPAARIPARQIDQVEASRLDSSRAVAAKAAPGLDASLIAAVESAAAPDNKAPKP